MEEREAEKRKRSRKREGMMVNTGELEEKAEEDERKNTRGNER